MSATNAPKEKAVFNCVKGGHSKEYHTSDAPLDKRPPATEPPKPYDFDFPCKQCCEKHHRDVEKSHNPFIKNCRLEAKEYANIGRGDWAKKVTKSLPRLETWRNNDLKPLEDSYKGHWGKELERKNDDQIPEDKGERSNH